MKTLLAWILASVGLLISSYAGGRASFNLRLEVQGDEFEGPRMVRPELVGEKELWFRVVPVITSSNVKSFTPFTADNGSYGVALKVDEDGWKNIREIGSTSVGKLLRTRVNGRTVQMMRVDAPKVDDYTVIIWRGLTEENLKEMRKVFKEIKPVATQEKPGENAPNVLRKLFGKKEE
jgi:hypothetical protein